MENKTDILINTNPFETRVALVEGGSLRKLYVERGSDKTITGNIYKGRIVRVLPGMQSAFIDIGLQRTAFLHIKDLREKPEGVEEDSNGAKEEKPRRGPTRIQDILKEGQDAVVQVTKEPIGTKGARVTTYISLAGRYLVLMPTYRKVAISRRIESERERRRLRGIVRGLRPEGCGFIIRTVCEGMKKDDIKADMDYLVKLHQRIEEKKKRLPSPSPLYEELDLPLRLVRDIFSTDVDRVIVDAKDEYDKISGFVGEFMPALQDRVELYEGAEGLFDVHGVEIELAGALERKVWLRSGGFLIIDQMEALTAVDVNTGKYVGKKSSAQTILKTNLEAVKEVVYQLRLRNIGGIIVIDFIDMLRAEDREKVYNELKVALKADKARSNILKISDFGIVEMTRKRVRESLVQSLCEPCPYCEGNAVVKDVFTVMMEIYRELKRELAGEKKKALLFCSPKVADSLEENREIIEDIEKRFNKRVTIKPVERFHQESFEIL
ncbi:MAG: ribonuclease E/G [Thermodesulfobacteriota bacterium]